MSLLKGNPVFSSSVICGAAESELNLPFGSRKRSKKYIEKVNDRIMEKFGDMPIGHTQHSKDLKVQIEEEIRAVGMDPILTWLFWWVAKQLVLWLISYYLDRI